MNVKAAKLRREKLKTKERRIGQPPRAVCVRNRGRKATVPAPKRFGKGNLAAGALLLYCPIYSASCLRASSKFPPIPALAEWSDWRTAPARAPRSNDPNTRECLVLEVDTSIGSRRVTRVLDG